MNVEPIIRPLSIDNLPRIAAIHIAAFPDSAMSQLGSEVVKQYYMWQLEGPHDAVNIGVFDSNVLVGFCFSGRFSGALPGFIDRNRFLLIKSVLSQPWLLFSSPFRERANFGLQRILGRIRVTRKRNCNSIPHTADIKPAYGILALAVEPLYQGSGVASIMMQYAEHEATKRGLKEMTLTVNPSNYRAIRFYEKMNWKKVYRNEVWTGRMKKHLNESYF